MSTAGWPLTGRDDDLVAIVDRLSGDRSAAHQGGGVVLVGGHGVGKSRLLRASLARAVGSGWRVARVLTSAAGRSVPLGAVAHLMPTALTEPEHPVPGPWLFHLIAAHLSRLGGAGRLLLAVDDAHLLDDVSTALVHHLLVQGHASIIATLPADEPVPEVVMSLWKDELADRRDLSPLSDAAIDTLIDHALPGTVSGLVRARLRRLATGNPRYLRELLRSGAESGALARDGHALWGWHAPLTPSARLVDLVQRLLTRAGPDAAHVTELVACGQPVPLPIMEGCAGLLAAERARLVEVVAEGGTGLVRLAHPIYGEVLAARRGPARSRGLYRQLVGRLEATATGHRHNLGYRLVGWRVDAGLPVTDDDLLAAAREAAADGDFRLAERLARPLSDRGDADALLVRADALSRSGRFAEALTLLAAGPTGELTVAERDTWGRSTARILYRGHARVDEALRVLPRPPAQGAADPTGNCLRALMMLSEGQIRQALKAAAPVLDTARTPSPPTGHVPSEPDLAGAVAAGPAPDEALWALGAAVAANALLGRTTEAINMADGGLAAGPDRPPTWPPTRPASQPASQRLRISRTHALCLAGRLQEAEVEGITGYWEAAHAGDRWLLARWAHVVAGVATLRGDLAAAERALREAVGLAAEAEPDDALAGLYLAEFAATRAMAGDPGDADRWMRRADATRDLLPKVTLPRLGICRAWALSAIAGPRRAVAEAMAAADDAGRGEQPISEALALYQAVRIGGTGRVPGPLSARLCRIANEVDSRLVAACAEAARVMHLGDGSGLEKAAMVLDDLGATLLAAEAMTVAAQICRGTRDPIRAARTGEAARCLAARCPHARTPLLDAVGTAPAGLTRRERQVAELARDGKSSAEIAEHLRLSVRTVDNHLARVYQKLGVSSRADLSGVLGRDPDPPEGSPRRR